MPHYPRHLRAFAYVGYYRYFLTLCTAERRQRFADAATVTLVCRQFLRAADEHQCAVLAYCFMPDHVHLLIEGEDERAEFKRFIKAAKQYSGFEFKRRHGEKLWQRYGFERVLRRQEATGAVIRYIVDNPIRAGLAKHPAAYPFWGSFRYSREELLEYALGPPEGGPYDV